jgi:hypothetical protein
METPFLNPSEQSPQESRNAASRQIVVSLLVVLLAIGAYFFLFKSPQRPSTQGTSPLTSGSPERAYVSDLRIGNLAMKQAENFLNQEVKILEGDVLNSGSKVVVAVDATVEFRDGLDQIALRETRPLVPPSPNGLAPGQVAHFELSFDHVPNSWNYQMPRVTITGLKLAADKK